MKEIIEWIKSNKRRSTITGLILFLIITNPSISSFKTYSGGEDCERKEADLFLFSIYKNQCDRYHYYYLGIAGNFISLQ